jgi:hypothetical protein|tara:strand:+ start:199 stop:390 length:192 start_codon:yes stop_codon:yes gene_type:complete
MKTILAYILFYIGDTVWNIIDTGILPDKLYDIGDTIYQKTMRWSSELDINDKVWGPNLIDDDE